MTDIVSLVTIRTSINIEIAHLLERERGGAEKRKGIIERRKRKKLTL